MKRITKILCLFFAILTVFLSGLYLLYIFVLPVILNSVKVNSYIEKIIYKKSGIEISTNNLKIKTYRNLSVSVLADKIELKKQNKKVFDANNIDIKIFPIQKKLSKIYIDYIYLDKSGLTNFLTSSTKKRNNIQFDMRNIPEIKINRTDIIIIDNSQDKSYIEIKNLLFKYDKQLKQISTLFDMILSSTHLNNDIKIQNQNNIRFDNNNIIIDNLNMFIGSEILTIKGNINPKNNKKELYITGNNIPVYDIEKSAIYYLKAKNNNKNNFMENFKDYTGNADFNLKLYDDGIYGTVLIKSFGAKTVLYNIPITFDNFTGFFDGDSIHAKAYGKFGYEKLFADFNMSYDDSKYREISGQVHADITNKTTDKYAPEFNIEGSVDVTVLYTISKSTPKITYIAKFEENSNLEYKNASLGLSDKKRHVLVRTEKHEDKLYIKEYEYSLLNDSEIYRIIKGEGLFEKIKNKMQPSYITIKTENPAPVSITGSFGRRLEGGTFNGDLKYDFRTNVLNGHFNLSDSKYKDFKITTADINAQNNIAIISSEGTYLNSPYKCYINMDNNFNNKITVHKIELFLDKYIIRAKKYAKNGIKEIKIPQKAKDLEYIVEEGNIKLNKLIHSRFIIENISVSGTIKDKIVKFNTEKADFAKGHLKANGIFNIENKDALIDFFADNIDSNCVATMVFKLPDQIKGTAGAKLQAKINTENQDIKAKASFSIKEGYLPKIGSTEFIIKLSNKNKSLKIKLSDIINIDISRAKAFASDIQGSFDMDNWTLKNIELFSKQKYLSLFIEGNYNIEDEDSDLRMWGKYNKTARNKVKILFIPLSVIMKIVFKEEKTMHMYQNKIKKIPYIDAQNNEIEFFRVEIRGNLNNNNVKVELKSLK